MMNDAIKFVALAAQGDTALRVVAQIEHPNGQSLGSWVMRWTRDDQKWVKFQVRWIGTSVAVVEAPLLEVVTMGPEGHALVLDRQGSRVEFPGGSEADMLAHGLMREVRRVGQSFVACGMGRQVYGRENGGSWGALHAGVLVKPGELAPVGFNSIDGASMSALVAVGFLGEIWRFGGGTWSQDSSPCNVTLHKVLHVPEVGEFAGGKLGTLLKAVTGAWQVLPQSVVKDDIRDLVWHDGRLFAVADDQLFVLSSGDDLELVVPQPPGGCIQFASNGSVLWAINSRHVLYSDDLKSWHDITP